MGGKVDISGIPEPIAQVYQRACASVDSVQDPKLMKALVAVIREVEREAISRQLSGAG